jgi:hypothetical protein
VGTSSIHRPHSVKERSLLSMGIANSAVAREVVTPPRSVYFTQKFVPYGPSGRASRVASALSVDYVLQGDIPLYIDCNPDWSRRVRSLLD